jgi:hypothetical protein
MSEPISSIYFTGKKLNTDGTRRVYLNGNVVGINYQDSFTGIRESPEQINKREGKLRYDDTYELGVDVVGGTDFKTKYYKPEEEGWSLSYIWEEYSSFVIGVIILIAAIIAFLVYRNINSPKIVAAVASDVAAVASDVVAAFGSIF